MPLYEIEIPGRGKFQVESPTPLTDAQAYAAVVQQIGAGTAQKPEGGFIAAAKAGATELGGGISALMGKVGLKDEAKAEAEYQAAKKRAAEIFKPTEEGWTEAPFTKFKELLGGSVPYMAAPLAAGAAAAALPVTGTAAALTTLGAAGLTSAGQFTATNLARQMEEGKKLGETSLGAAAAAAIPQTSHIARARIPKPASKERKPPPARNTFPSPRRYPVTISSLPMSRGSAPSPASASAEEESGSFPTSPRIPNPKNWRYGKRATAPQAGSSSGTAKPASPSSPSSSHPSV
jgi:hypothetical protein